MICQHCGHRNDSDAAFCVQCSHPLTKRCHNCSALNTLEAQFCKKCGAELADLSIDQQAARLQGLRAAAPKGLQDKLRMAQNELEGQRKPVTILFADIVGSSAIAETLDPEDWKEVVQGAHYRISEAIHRYEGTIAQLLGDGILAFFGAPLTHEDDPERAVRAALNLQESIAGYRRELSGFVENFQMRVGIHAGEVVVGPVGTNDHAEYLAIGDAVNLASRLESAAEPGQVLISETCARMIEHAFDLGELKPISAKGKRQSMLAAVVTGLKSEPGLSRGIGGVRTPFIGRETEIAQLQSALLALCQGQGGIVSLVGEAGIGKTRLLEQVQEISRTNEAPELSTHYDPRTLRWIEGRGLSYGASLSFWAINMLLLDDLGLTNSAPQIKIKSALRKRVQELFDKEKADEIWPYFAHLLGLSLEGEAGEVILNMDGEAIKYQTLIYLAEYFERISKQEPAVVVLEDLHWADPSSLEALKHLIPLADRCPILLVLIMRDDRDHGSWDLRTLAGRDFPHRLTEIHLDRLDADESQRLIAFLLSPQGFPEELRQLILSRSEGNPFYLEEVVHHLLEAGLIKQEQGHWTILEGIDDIGIPETLQGVLLARIDRLEEDVRGTLQRASVIGKSFLFKLLQAIAEAERELDSHLTQLQRVDLVREKARLPELEYMFKHSLTQEAAYNSLLVDRRKAFHLKVGEAVETLFPDRQEEFLGLLAHHFKAAGMMEKAVDYLILAGDKARLADAHDEAISLYRQALPILDTLQDRSRAHELWLRIGLSHHINSRHADSKEAYASAYKLAEQAKTSTPVIVDDPQMERVLRFPVWPGWIQNLDPGKSIFEWNVVANLFSGLTRMEDMHSVKPHLAWSWDISDDGKRYVFHLRDDATWSDGTLITADQFEWAWIRNLAPGEGAYYAWTLYDVVGAREFRMGEIKDPKKVGVRALDPLRLEVRLKSPANYFLYLLALPIAFPLPQWTIEQHGEDWWRPEHIVTSGPFTLSHFDENRLEFTRNPSYFMPIKGNLDRAIGVIFQEHDVNTRRAQFAQAFSENKIDRCPMALDDIPPDTPREHIRQHQSVSTYFLLLNPAMKPLDNRLLRQALALVIDTHEYNREIFGKPATGGLIHPRTQGHTPGIQIRLDEEKARRKLEEAGFPGGKGIPELQMGVLGRALMEDALMIANQITRKLGIKVNVFETDVIDRLMPFHLQFQGWEPDYPDPDSVLRRSSIRAHCEYSGYKREEFLSLLGQAQSELDRKQRLAHFRAIDRWLVKDEILCIPLLYGSIAYVRENPKIKHYPQYTFNLEDVVLSD